MQSGQIGNDQITLYEDGIQESDKYKVRLNNGGDYWSTGSGYTEADLGYIQVDLLEEKFVAQVATQVKDGGMKFSVYKIGKNDNRQIIRTENGNHVRKLLIYRNTCKLFRVGEFCKSRKKS